jgi:uncharacterized membrane-anchored protein
MPEASSSDLAYGLALGATAVAVVISLVATGFLYWNDGDPLIAIVILVPLAVAVFQVVRLRRRRQERPTDDA